jgi:hypothetical protein
MRATGNLVVAYLITFAFTMPAIAQTEKPGGGAPVQGGTMAPITTKPRGPAGPVRAPVAGKKAPLTESECTQLGGHLDLMLPGVCDSGKACITHDENNKTHAVCISKK